MTEPNAPPLDGLRVVDCSGMISGGFATLQLADFGADVVMVEHPDYPDAIREWGPFDEGVSLWWKSLARNKRCVTLDLKTDEGKALLLELVDGADLFFENFRPGTLEGWGIGPERLWETNPDLVVVRLSGYGQTGPRSAKPGYGTVAEGYAGWAHVNGFPDREPLLPPISLADLTAAQFAVQAAMFAIYERDVGGADRGGGDGDDTTDGGAEDGTPDAGDDGRTGQVVDVSLYEPLFRLFVGDVEGYDRLGRVPGRTGNRHPNAAPRNVYETADGHVTLSASSQRIFENVMVAIDRPELIEDERFATNDRRVRNVEALDEAIEAWTREHATGAVIETMEAHDAIVGPIYDVADAVADPQFRAREDVVEVADDDLGSVATVAPVPKFSRTHGRIDHMGPGHGEHNEAVFVDELGLDREEFARLRNDGVM